MTPARYFDESKHEPGSSVVGVPVRDLSQEEYDALPDYLQRSVDAAPFYRKTRVPSEKQAAKTYEDKET